MDLRLLVLVYIVQSASAELVLDHVGTVYIPLAYGKGGPPHTYAFNADLAPQVAVEPDRAIAYTFGSNLLHVIDFSNLTHPVLAAHEQVFLSPVNAEVQDITFCGDWVAVSVNSFTSPLNGFITVYNKYEPGDPELQTVHTVSVGAHPRYLHFTPDCSRLLVAIHGDVVSVSGQVVDPEGGLQIVDFGANGPDAGVDPTTQFYGFMAFNDRADEYMAMGVRKTYNGEGTSDIISTAFSQDLAPESLDLSADGRFAYVCLQENNAIAVFDMTSMAWLDIYPLGTTSFAESSGSVLDTSDMDGGVNLQHWPVRGLLQPDNIKAVEWGGVTYIVTANEGDDRDYTVAELRGMDEDWLETEIGKNLLPNMSASVTQEVRDMLADDAQLGRLTFSLYDGLDGQGGIENLTIFGGRSVSVFRASDMTLMADSGSILEETMAKEYPDVFNGDAGNEAMTPAQSSDTRSTLRGIEPEAITVGRVGDHAVVFAGCERPGSIAVLSVDLDSMNAPRLQFESVYYGGGRGKTWQELYDDMEMVALDVEDLVFIPAGGSGQENAVLVAAGKDSGTLSFFHINDTAAGSGALRLSGCLALALFILLLHVVV